MAKKIAACIDRLLALNGCLMIACAALQIASRALGRPVPWTVEALTFLGLFSVVPGEASHFLKGTETRVGFLADRLPRRARAAAEAAVGLVCAAFGCALFWGAADYAALAGMSVSDRYLPLPPEADVLPVFVLAAAVFFNGLRATLRAVKLARAGEGGNARWSPPR